MDYEYEASGTITATISSIVRIDLSIIVFIEKMVRYDVVDRPEAFFYRLLERGRINKISHSTPTQKVGVFLYKEEVWQ